MRASGLGSDEAAARDMWGLPEQLLAEAVDALRWLVWSKTKDASRPGSKPPPPIDRPGVEPEHKQHRGTAMPLDQARQRLEVARI